MGGADGEGRDYGRRGLPRERFSSMRFRLFDKTVCGESLVAACVTKLRYPAVQALRLELALPADF